MLISYNLAICLQRYLLNTIGNRMNIYQPVSICSVFNPVTLRPLTDEHICYLSYSKSRWVNHLTWKGSSIVYSSDDWGWNSSCQCHDQGYHAPHFVARCLNCPPQTEYILYISPYKTPCCWYRGHNHISKSSVLTTDWTCACTCSRYM